MESMPKSFGAETDLTKTRPWAVGDGLLSGHPGRPGCQPGGERSRHRCGSSRQWQQRWSGRRPDHPRVGPEPHTQPGGQGLHHADGPQCHGKSTPRTVVNQMLLALWGAKFQNAKIGIWASLVIPRSQNTSVKFFF